MQNFTIFSSEKIYNDLKYYSIKLGFAESVSKRFDITSLQRFTVAPRVGAWIETLNFIANQIYVLESHLV